MSARRHLIAALSEDSLGGIATLQDVAHAEQLVDAHRAEARAEALTEAIDDITNCLRLGGMQRLGLVLARKRLIALRDGTPAESPRRNIKHAEAAQRLREQPGQWLPVGDYSSDQGGYGTARHINLGTIPAYQPAGAYEARFEATENGTRVHARYVGTTAEAGDGRD